MAIHSNNTPMLLSSLVIIFHFSTHFSNASIFPLLKNYCMYFSQNFYRFPHVFLRFFSLRYVRYYMTKKSTLSLAQGNFITEVRQVIQSQKLKLLLGSWLIPRHSCIKI